MAPHIVLVADDPALRELLYEVLTDAGYAVQPGPRARLRPQDVRGPAPQLILLDCFVCPGMAGPAPWEEWTTDPATAQVPLILLSDGWGGAPRPALEVLSKPFDLDDLLALVAARVRASA